MSERKDAASTGASYAVGYGKPPTHTRFRPGQSGNPAGRRKGVRNLNTDVKRTLKMPVRMKEGGRTHTISTQEGALRMLRAGSAATWSRLTTTMGHEQGINRSAHLLVEFEGLETGSIWAASTATN